MPEKQLTIAAYAAGASLAAISLVYVFGPTFFIDGGEGNTSASSRKNKAVGLSNPANDCFINSVLQALAGLGDLRKYLILEINVRDNGDPSIYTTLVEDPVRKGMPPWKVEGLQVGQVTRGLKIMLDTLNERPIYKKTASAMPFIGVLEQAFKQKISRQQQDAQEFLQIVAERLCDECHAGHRAREFAKKIPKIASIQEVDDALDEAVDRIDLVETRNSPLNPAFVKLDTALPKPDETSEASTEDSTRKLTSATEDVFPLEGASESQIECLTCKFKPKPTKSTFCSLTLSVPQVGSTTLSSCFDQMFKTEFIEDFKCEKCRLLHALETFQQELARSNSEKFKITTQKAIDRIEQALATDPEEELKDIELPDRKFAPKRKIAKHSRITKFPKVMAIHLSRSIFDAGSTTMKNSAKVSFPERLPLGGLLNQKFYRLSSIICHKGSHHSGHYESFRRQIVVTAPFSTPNALKPAEAFGLTPTASSTRLSTPHSASVNTLKENGSPLPSTPEIPSPASASSSSPSLSDSNGRPLGDWNVNNRSQSSSSSASAFTDATTRGLGPTSAPGRKDSDTGSIRSFAKSARSVVTSKVSKVKSKTEETTEAKAQDGEGAKQRRKRLPNNRWWRISDDKIKESKTSDILGMQKEVYLLFYELERED